MGFPVDAARARPRPGGNCLARCGGIRSATKEVYVAKIQGLALAQSRRHHGVSSQALGRDPVTWTLEQDPSSRNLGLPPCFREWGLTKYLHTILFVPLIYRDQRGAEEALLFGIVVTARLPYISTRTSIITKPV